MARPDEVLVTIPQIAEIYRVRLARVRGWVYAGRLKPIRRKGQGRSSKMYFSKADVVELVFGCCEGCGNWFRRETLKQKYCGPKCRKAMHYHRKKANIGR